MTLKYQNENLITELVTINENKKGIWKYFDVLPLSNENNITQLSGFVEKLMALFFPIPKVLRVISIAT